MLMNLNDGSAITLFELTNPDGIAIGVTTANGASAKAILTRKNAITLAALLVAGATKTGITAAIHAVEGLAEKLKP